MNILCLGNEGFIGSHITRELLRRGHHVTGVTRRPSRLEPHPAYAHVQADRRHPSLEALLSPLGSFDSIVDVVAYDAEDVKCIHFLRERTGHYLQIGSGGVYIPLEIPAPYRETDYSCHTLVKNPDTSPRLLAYVHGKQRAEAMARELFSPVTIIHPPIVLGADDVTQRLLHYVKAVKLQQGVPLTHGGMAAASYVFADCLAASIANVLENSTTHGQIINIASRTIVTVRWMVKRIAHLLQLPLNILPPDATPDPFATLEAYILDLSRAEAAGVLVDDDFLGRFDQTVQSLAQSLDVRN